MTDQVVPSWKEPPRPKAKRKRVKPVSSRRLAEREARDEIRAAVFARDRWRCRLEDTHRTDRRVPTCRGVLTPHHVLKASQGGGYTEDNLISLCAGHNTWVEDAPNVAHELGLVRRRGDA